MNAFVSHGELDYAFAHTELDNEGDAAKYKTEKLQYIPNVPFRRIVYHTPQSQVQTDP